MSSLAAEHTQRLILDGTKMGWHQARINAWERGERIAPITIDMALTRSCNFACEFCYAMLQENTRSTITREVIFDFLEDCSDIGVRGISLVSDGESSVSPLGVIFPTSMSPDSTAAPTKTIPRSSKSTSASSDTFGISCVISSIPRFVSRTWSSSS